MDNKNFFNKMNPKLPIKTTHELRISSELLQQIILNHLKEKHDYVVPNIKEMKWYIDWTKVNTNSVSLGSPLQTGWPSNQIIITSNQQNQITISDQAEIVFIFHE